MKKIIEGKLYDTEKAEKIVDFKTYRETETVLGVMQFGHESALYKTKKGAWFKVVGVGTKWAEMHVIVEEEAKEIIQLYPDVYTEMYDDVEEA